MAWVMSRVMRLSGAESLAAAANVFVGQTEAPLLVKPLCSEDDPIEILALMVGGHGHHRRFRFRHLHGDAWRSG